MRLIKFRGWDNIFAVDRFEKEFEKLTKEKASKDPPDRYNSWLHNRCEKLDRDGKEAIDGFYFEDLKTTITADGEEFNLYSIRYSRSKLNPRVIFSIYEGQTFILLYSFAEKSTNDYKKAIALCKNRLKAIVEEE